MKLREEFAALDFGNLRVHRTLRQRAIRIEPGELQFEAITLISRFGSSGYFQKRLALSGRALTKLLPRNKKRIISGNLLRVFVRLDVERLRIAQNKNGVCRQKIQLRRQSNAAFRPLDGDTVRRLRNIRPLWRRLR